MSALSEISIELSTAIETASLLIEDCFCRHYANGRIERLRVIQTLLLDFNMTSWALPLRPKKPSDIAPLSDQETAYERDRSTRMMFRNTGINQ